MVYEVCALVLTIVFSMVGVYIVIVLHATKGLISESRQALKTVNENSPVVLSAMQCAAASLMAVVKFCLKIWRIIRRGEGKLK
ncbi:MAG: hypothetical protein WA131_03205 [Desulfitobacteriaceae bacterium]